MNRTGLFIALGVGVATALAFGLIPDLDLRLARAFYDADLKGFPWKEGGLARFARDAAMWIAWGFALPSILALIAKLVFPHRPLLVSARTMIFILTTIILSAGITSNLIFKSHWGRPRPVATEAFGGPYTFKPWWDPRGDCPRNCSFFSGEAATAFWTYAPAALAPPQWRVAAYSAATLFGLATGGLRMTFGGHYATDVLFAGVAVFLIIWIVHGMVFRWPRPPRDDDRIDRRMSEQLIATRRKIRSTARAVTSLALTPARAFAIAVLLLGALTAARIAGLSVSVVDLFYDESQYWAWAQHLAAGYFSKPPLLAWIIAGAQSVCGASEACIRAPAPLFYFGTSLAVFGVALTLYGARAALWTSLCLALAPGLVFSSRIISTDVPMLFFWSVALLAFVKLRARVGWGWAIVLGTALGLGILAKYAMIYFVVGVALAALIDGPTRNLLKHRALWAALVLAALIVLPNVLWNASHDFVTLRHTEDNISGTGLSFNPVNALEFVGSQFGVFGPFVFGAFLMILVWPPLRRALSAADRVMVAFALPPVALVTALGFVSHANANWAAASVISLTVVAVAVMLRRQNYGLLVATIVLGLIVQSMLWYGDARADRLALPGLAKPDLYRRTLGWRALGAQTDALASAHGAKSIAADQRDLVASLIYYARGGGRPVYSWPAEDMPGHQFDIDRPLTAATAEPILAVSSCASPAHFATRYAQVVPLGAIETATGQTSKRTVFAFRLTGATGSAAPPGPCG